MRFTGLFTLLSLVASVLAGRYIVILHPTAILNDFIAKLESGGPVWVVRRYESHDWFYGAVIETNAYTVESLQKFEEVLIAEEDRIMTIDPIPGPVLPSLVLPGPGPVRPTPIAPSPRPEIPGPGPIRPSPRPEVPGPGPIIPGPGPVIPDVPIA